MRPRAEEALAAARAAGFDAAALLPAQKLAYHPNAEAARQRVEGDPRALLPQAKSVLVMVSRFTWFSAWPEGCAEVSAFYFQSNRTYRAMKAAAEALRAQGALVDDSQRIPAKLWAARAGFGAQGRNTLLCSSDWGTCITLQTLVTDIEPGNAAAHPVPTLDEACGACRRCVEACPAGALDGRGNLEPEKCLRAWQFSGRATPEPLREKNGTRLLGCEICQRVCPKNARLPQIAPPCEPFRLETLLRFDKAARAQLGAAIGANEARPGRVLAQAALAAGNSGNRAYLPALKALCAHENPIVAGHARWAAERLREKSNIWA